MKNTLKKCFATTRRTITSIICIIAAVALIGTATVYAGVRTTAIGADAAANYAFAAAGVDPAAAVNLKTEFGLESGQFVYEVEFTADGSEYEYWIKASDGTVVKKTVEIVTAEGTIVTVTATITTDEAKKIALADAGLTAEEVTFTQEKLDYDDGINIYDIEFYTENAKYEYEINAGTGAVYSKSKETFTAASEIADSAQTGEADTTETDTAGNGTGSTAASTGITLAEAKSIVLADAGVSASDVTYTKAKTDTDDGVSVYDIEFYTATKEYEYEVRVSDGKIVDKDVETIKTATGTGSSSAGTSSTSSGSTSTDSYISVDDAKTIALNKAGLTASEVTFEKAKLEKDDGIMVYEIEFSKGRTEYDCTINAATGAIIEYEVDVDD